MNRDELRDKLHDGYDPRRPDPGELAWQLNRIREEFFWLLTRDSVTTDRRRKDYNQAVFDPETYQPVWSKTTLDMVLDKLDRAINNVRGEP